MIIDVDKNRADMAKLLDRMKNHLGDAKGIVCVVLNEDGDYTLAHNIKRMTNIEAIGVLEAVQHYLQKLAYD
jgi:hypothetical protein